MQLTCMELNSAKAPKSGELGELRDTETLISRLLTNCGKLIYRDGMQKARQRAREQALSEEALSEEVKVHRPQEPTGQLPTSLV